MWFEFKLSDLEECSSIENKSKKNMSNHDELSFKNFNNDYFSDDKDVSDHLNTLYHSESEVICKDSQREKIVLLKEIQENKEELPAPANFNWEEQLEKLKENKRNYDEYKVVWWDNLWKIVWNKYKLSKPADILNKLKDIIFYHNSKLEVWEKEISMDPSSILSIWQILYLPKNIDKNNNEKVKEIKEVAISPEVPETPEVNIKQLNITYNIPENINNKYDGKLEETYMDIFESISDDWKEYKIWEYRSSNWLKWNIVLEKNNDNYIMTLKTPEELNLLQKLLYSETSINMTNWEKLKDVMKKLLKKYENTETKE
jgi:hypothetical protein